jgi:hypothetical protein
MKRLRLETLRSGSDGVGHPTLPKIELFARGEGDLDGERGE